MNAPLADRLRPTSLDQMVGQTHLLSQGCALRRIIESGNIPNLIFYGPSGTGKTTLASIIAAKTDKKLHRLNCTTASTADIKEVVAEIGTLTARNGILLYLDEIQYFNKKQQQSLLEHIENGNITLIASTTENPYFYVYSALLSRSTVFEFKSVTAKDIVPAIDRAFAFLGKEESVTVSVDPALFPLIGEFAGGDVRKAMNICELCMTAGEREGDTVTITAQTVKELTANTALKYDRTGDEHYDCISAFQKSMRGSDPDAALYYLGRILMAGDLPSACRRLMVCACEDVGLAYPQIIPIVKSAVDIALQVGMPEARIPLADAVVLVAMAPKSATGHDGINAVMEDLQSGKTYPVPRHLQNKHFDGEDQAVKGQHYKYPHAYSHHWVDQTYLPDRLVGTTYYTPGDNTNEPAFAEYWKKIKG
ncbi:MAG: replication-associated recombination protein A [Clostridia bacterium]|nr:replication-associated recombination protein A [Clostridia bacterium]